MLDTGPLGAIANPKNNPETTPIMVWLRGILDAGHDVVIPEISDYELRRNLILEALSPSLSILDELVTHLSYLPITTDTMRKAAEVWADARKRGKRFAADEALDGDAILIAQAELCPSPTSVVVATTNVGHLSLFVKAEVWSNIHP